MENIVEANDKLVESYDNTREETTIESEKIKSKEENEEIYISCSKKNIDNYIHKREYRKAFGLLILVLERLDDGKMTRDFIDYYSDNILQMGIFDNFFPSS